MGNTKKIVFTTENVNWGGSELLWTKTIPELVNQECKIGVCVNQKLQLPDWIVALENEKRICVYKTPVSGLSKIKQIANKFLPYKFRLKPKDKRQEFISEFHPDLLVINQGFNFNGVDLMDFAMQSKINYVTISHAVNEGLWPDLNLRKKMILGFGNSQKNYFVSKDNLEVTEAQLGVSLQNNEVIRNPFNVPFAIDLAYPKQENYHLAYVGRYDFYAKGQDVLLRVLAKEKWKKRNIVVNFYGEGNDVENLKDMIQLYEIKNAIVHPYSSTIDIWKKNQALVLTSRFEGLPLVLVEAMLCKRFAIITNVSGNKELIEDNQTGFIAAAPRPEYVDEAMERAWQVRENWQLIGEEARKQLIKHIPENPALVFANQLTAILNGKN
ncbi:glycosyltransferase [Flavobacterium gawalongense]|uniref:Glycosyltransferase n=1 Tax=Flavobacterium gawalongense TaxID=2594432 RepID=A0ABY3CQC1_9FLAO|nr:glycosyltransferase [Flavobacterium gawalongense]TRX04545.1 glycosyltransferase [Flavobacterium gawalongense]TRX10432.1 glycosyltransferase [Flavobacterium gawalongense]